MTSRRARKLRHAEFEAVVHEYEARLLRYATRLSANPAAAEDIVQETFLKLLRSWKDAMTASPRMQSWLYRVTHNEAVDHIRRESRRQNLHAHDSTRTEAHIAPLPRPPESPDGQAPPSDRAAAAAHALQALSPRERDLVILKVYEEKSYREIAELKDLSVGNVGYILHHAMRKLAQRLNPSHEPDA